MSRDTSIHPAIPAQSRRPLAANAARAPIVDERALHRLISLELLRHRTEPGLVAVYAVAATAPEGGEAAVATVGDVTALRLLAALRPSDVVGRLADGTFGVLADGLLSAAAVFALNARLLHALREPVDVLGERPVLPRVSIGLALTGNPLREAHDMVRHACLALTNAERAGGNRIALADPQFSGLLDIAGKFHATT